LCGARSFPGKANRSWPPIQTAVGGTVSRIVAQIEGPATDPRADTQYIVTEYGVADMRGKSSPERAEALITIAHPAFRDELRRTAVELGYL
jgi:acyl-CoA hydrolase